MNPARASAEKVTTLLRHWVLGLVDVTENRIAHMVRVRGMSMLHVDRCCVVRVDEIGGSPFVLKIWIDRTAFLHT